MTLKIRLNRFIADNVGCSRREADKLIFSGKVKIGSDFVLDPSLRVDPDESGLNIDELKKELGKLVYIKLNKPRGYVVSTNDAEGIPVNKLVDIPGCKLYPIGRLDKDSTGLLLFSNDSSLPAKIIGEQSNCVKEYYVKVAEPISDSALDKLREGINLWGIKTLSAEIRRLNEQAFMIELREGKNRQIRRMCQKVGNRVVSLKRVRVHTVNLGGLESGKWEYLSKREVDDLLSLG